MKLLDLARFRKDNGFTQDDLARILNITRAYISRIETGRANLSDKKIDDLVLHPEDWETSGLVPCFSRLMTLAYFLHENDSSFYYKLQKPPSLDDDLWYNIYCNDLPFYGILREETILAIRHGKSEITDGIADAIVSAFPQVNRNWLLTGEGTMLKDETRQSVDNLKESLEEKFNRIEKKIDINTQLLESIAQFLGIPDNQLS